LPGKLIAFEGIDGSGTTTQSRMMHSALLEKGVPVHLTQEPSEGPVGGLIRQVLTSRLVTRGRTGLRSPSWSTLALMFAADRLDHLESEIEPNLEDGVSIITDRYLHSSLVYQSAAAGTDEVLDWLWTINRFARQPDLVIFLDVKPTEAQRRRMDRRIIQEIFDDVEMQERIAEQYRKLFSLLDDEVILRVDGQRGETEIHEQCMARLAELGVP
jgi:dTMP kinase